MSGTDIVPLGGIDYKIGVHRETQWVRIEAEDGRSLFCTMNHPLYHESKGRVPADIIVPGDCLIMDNGVRGVKDVDWTTRVCSKYSVHMPDGHLYYANGYLSHNQKVIGP